MAGTRKYTDDEIIAALNKTRGLVYLAAKKLKCHFDTIYDRMKKSKRVAAAVVAARGEIVDVAEQRLFEAVADGDHWAVGMILKTLGKDRGYVERSEVVTDSDELGADVRKRLNEIDRGGRRQSGKAGSPDPQNVADPAPPVGDRQPAPGVDGGPADPAPNLDAAPPR